MRLVHNGQITHKLKTCTNVHQCKVTHSECHPGLSPPHCMTSSSNSKVGKVSAIDRAFGNGSAVCNKGCVVIRMKVGWLFSRVYYVHRMRKREGFDVCVCAALEITFLSLLPLLKG